MCLEFAVGSVSRVLGPEFEIVDSFKKRVRLPDEPLMLVDRIISIEGEKLSLSSGKIVTEHDVLPCAWYLDGGRAPVCISVEAGQADLFLCSYLGIDHRVKGERVYRLLDASVVFHRGLPVEGETIRYEIEIDKFVRRGETYLFFFHFKGYIGATPLITMTDGCAGFFTDEEIKNSGGIILTEEDSSAAPETIKTEWNDFIQVERKEILDYSLNALRLGDAEKCFGGSFRGITIGEQLRLPGGRMKLIDRILDLDPKGGRSGLGLIKAEADIHPDDWFLTCHFSDDMVMPGTLMYECCAHTLRVFVQQTGWISDKPGTCYEPLTGVKSILKCRGPVTPETKHVHYEVEIKQTGYNPEPYVIADARMYTDGHLIVLFKDMSLKMTGIKKEELEAFWTRQKQNLKLEHIPPPLFDREKLVEFALGKPSKAFGEPYKIFDENRFIARLPNPPYLFIDKIIHCEPEPWILKPDGWIKALFEVRKDDWYFISNKSPVMPYSVLLETALQSCGWLAAYMGSALKSKKDLRFRNLGRSGILHKNISQKNTSLVTAARLKQASVTKDMIIEKFEFKVSENDITIFEGNTEFGFFTLEALKQQTGIIDAEKRSYIPSTYELENKKAIIFHPEPPLRPYDSGKNEVKLLNYLWTSPTLTTLIDEIETYLPHGGPFGFGYIRGKKYVDPDEWFFKAHFFQDPVCPGSLGVESFIQLLKFAALEIWGDKAHHHKFEMVTGKEHQWKYRGQITPENKIVEVEAVITEIKNAPEFVIMANGLLKVDGLYIYEMNNFGIKYNAL